MIQVPQLAASNGFPGNNTIAFVLGLGKDLLDDHSWGKKIEEMIGKGLVAPWFSSKARRLMTKLLDPNPSTRITISKVMDSSWFKKSIPKVILTKQKQEFDEPSDKITSKQTETLNAFHIILLSDGFDLSPLFEEKKQEEREELRFVTTLIKKSDSMVRLQGQESGRKGKLAIAEEIFVMTPSFLVVKVKKDNGDTLEVGRPRFVEKRACRLFG
ncbi:hypothetical protein ACFXTO_024409 [Malus domestica]